MSKLGSEPVAIIGIVDAGLVAAQQALSTSSGVHAAIAAAIVVLSAALTRAQVTPVGVAGKAAAPAPPVA